MSTGWTFPAPSDSNFYTEWASGQNFVVGDKLRMILPSILYDFSTLTDACCPNTSRFFWFNSTIEIWPRTHRSLLNLLFAVFTYGEGEHDVQVSTLAEYTGCTMGNGQVYSSGSDTVKLPTAGDYYFICNFITHCANRMKMKVTVGASLHSD